MIRRFFDWWFTELKALLPSRLRAWLFPPQERVVLIFGRGNLAVAFDSRDGERRDLGRVVGAAEDPGAAEALGSLLARGKVRETRAVIELSSEVVLAPQLELPVDAAENLKEVLDFEMDRQTPFSADEVYYDYRILGTDPDLERLNLEMRVATRRDVAAARRLAEAAGLRVLSVCGPGDSRTAQAMNLLPRDNSEKSGALLPRLAAALVIVAVILAGLALYLPLKQSRQELAKLEGEVDQARSSAAIVARLQESLDSHLAQRGSVVAKKRDGHSTLEILNEITRLLPDHSWLLQLSLRDGSINLVGYSDDPSSIIRLLEQSEALADVTFAAPITRDPRIDRDRFISDGADRGGRKLMNLEMPPWMSRTAAIALLLSLVGGAVFFGILPVVEAYRGVDDDLAHNRDLLHRLSSVAAEQSRLEEQVAQVRTSSRYRGAYLESEIDSLAGAELRERLSFLLEEEGGDLQSSQSLGSDDSDGAPRATLSGCPQRQDRSIAAVDLSLGDRGALPLHR